MFMGRILKDEEVLAFYRGVPGHPFLGFYDMMEVMKSAGTVTTDLGTPYFNRIYGQYVWTLLNKEANAFAMLPKTTWIRSGWRMFVDWARASEDELGVSETGTLPAAAYPQLETARVKPKIEMHVFEISNVMELLGQVSQDDVWGVMSQIKAFAGQEFIKQLNRQLLKKAFGEATDGSDSILEAEDGTRLLSLDRIVSSSAEASAVGAAGYEDIYGIDRSASSWADAYVKMDLTNGVQLTTQVIYDTLKELRVRGANTNVILTGPATEAYIWGMWVDFIRLLPMSESYVTYGVNGVQTAKGIDAGVKVASIQGIPLIVSVDIPKDSGQLERVYFLDVTDTEGYGVPRGGISILQPPSYYETDLFLLMNKYIRRGAYVMIGETTFRAPRFQGKIRDLRP